MSLFKYFKVRCGKTDGSTSSSSLPDPSGPLSEKMPATSIEEANKEVYARQTTSGKRHGQYVIVTPEQKARVAKYTAENGTANAIRRFAKDMPDLKENTVRGWKTVYLRELASRCVTDEEDVAGERLPARPKGRPLLLGQELD